MKLTFDLILACDGTVLDTAGKPGELCYGNAYPYERWCVIVRTASLDRLATFTKCVAWVNLTASEDFRADYDFAVEEVEGSLRMPTNLASFRDLTFGPMALLLRLETAHEH